MKNWKEILLIIIGVILVVVIYINIADFNPVNKEDKLLKKLNELELKIDSLNANKDSIRKVVDSTHVKIITNEKHYKERIDIIISQPLSADSQYISDYIGRYIESHRSYFQ